MFNVMDEQLHTTRIRMHNQHVKGVERRVHLLYTTAVVLPSAAGTVIVCSHKALPKHTRRRARLRRGRLLPKPPRSPPSLPLLGHLLATTESCVVYRMGETRTTGARMYCARNTIITFLVDCMLVEYDVGNTML